MADIIPSVCIDDSSTSINVDFPWNTGNLPLCVFGQHLKAQTTPGIKHTYMTNSKTADSKLIKYQGENNSATHAHEVV